jgi:hypothetical protein
MNFQFYTRFLALCSLVLLLSCDSNPCGTIESYPLTTFRDSVSVFVPSSATALRYIELSGQTFGTAQKAGDKDSVAPTYVYNQSLGDTLRFVVTVSGNVNPTSRLPFGSKVSNDSLRLWYTMRRPIDIPLAKQGASILCSPTIAYYMITSLQIHSSPGRTFTFSSRTISE